MNTSAKIRGYRRLFFVAALVLGLDQLSKWWIFQNLEMNREHITVIDGFFYIVHVGNEGAAWGMFSGHGGPLTLFAALALLAIYFFRHSLQLKLPLVQLFFGLLIGGIIGNAIDRMIHGHVIDFLDFHLPFSIPRILENGHYPTFNIADCGIVIGVFLLHWLQFSAATTSRTTGLSGEQQDASPGLVHPDLGCGSGPRTKSSESAMRNCTESAVAMRARTLTATPGCRPVCAMYCRKSGS